MDDFDHTNIDFPVQSGDVVQQPVAYVRDPDSVRRVSTGGAAASVGVNTVESSPDLIDSSRLKALPPTDAERNAYLSQLVSSKSTSQAGSVHAGRSVDVCYYGVHFPGYVVKRNVGSGTFTIKFDDGTINDFPIHAVMLK